MCVCVCVCARTCVYVCVRARVRVCGWLRGSTRAVVYGMSFSFVLPD